MLLLLLFFDVNNGDERREGAIVRFGDATSLSVNIPGLMALLSL